MDLVAFTRAAWQPVVRRQVDNGGPAVQHRLENPKHLVLGVQGPDSPATRNRLHVSPQVLRAHLVTDPGDCAAKIGSQQDAPEIDAKITKTLYLVLAHREKNLAT